MNAYTTRAPRIGFWCTLPSSIPAEIFARSGADYVCVDYQHGLFDHTGAVHAFQAISAGGAAAFARVATNQPSLIASALDAGATTVVIPLVNTVGDAEAAVRACHYPPRGRRSFGPVRARLTHGSSQPEVLDQVECLVMIETSRGLRNVAETVATPGVDGVFVGPSDLAIALGLSPHSPPYQPALDEAVKAIAAACKQAGKVAGIAVPDGIAAAEYVERGFDLIGISSDTAMLTQVAALALSQARGGQDAVAAGPASTY